MADDPGRRILYDILVSLEWPTERHDLPQEDFPSLWRSSSALVKGWYSAVFQILKYPFRSFLGTSALPEFVVNAVSMRIPWQLCLSHHGNIVAIVKDEAVEVWAISGDKDRVQLIGRCTVGKDPMPQWRKVAWSTQDALFAVSSSSGEIFLFGGNGSLIAHLTDAGDEDDLRTAYAGLMFVPAVNYGLESRMDVLVAVTYAGHLRCYQVAGEFRLLHSFDFTRVCPGGVGGVLYHTYSKILVVGGWGSPEGTAISCWRMLDGAPHYSRVGRDDDKEKSSGRMFGILAARMDSGGGGIFHLALSPSGALLVGIDGDGQLTLWDMPSGRMRKSWKLDSQPKLVESEETVFGDNSQARKDRGTAVPVDVNWWTEDAVIVAYSTGDVIVADLEELNNHLGSNPETCEPGCLVSPSTGGGFFVLERFSEVKMIPSAFTALAAEERDGPSENEASHEGATTRLIKQILYYVTDAERFRPPQRAAKAAYHTYRLLALQSTTPEELFERKINLEEYKEALDLARVYGLDCDEVYKKQWERTPVSVDSIQEYLSKVSNTHWVLRECLICVPHDYNTAMKLLKYGLSKTDFSHLVDLHADSEDLIQSIEGRGDKEEDDLGEIIGHILSWGELNEEQKSLCHHRLKLLQLLDRLSCYERVLGGVRSVERRYSSEEFRQFREENLVQLAVQYARASDAKSLAVLMTVFGEDTLPHWLPILSNFPETTPPCDYEDILPTESEGGVYLWEQELLRSKDWCENPQVMKMCDVVIEELDQQNSGDFLYEDRPDWINYRGPVDNEMLSLWFQERAIEIEYLSGQVDNALSLVKLGVDRRMPQLAVVYHNLQTLSTLVYECNADPSFSLHLMKTMSNLDKVQAMLRKVEPSGFSRTFKEHVLPFLHRLDLLEPGSGGQVVEDFLLATAVDDLERCYDVVRIVTKKGVLEKLTVDISDLMSLTVQCIYVCDRSDQIDVAFAIIECLPPRSKTDSASLQQIHDKLDELEDILDVARKLAKYNAKKTPQHIKRISSDCQQVEQVLTLFARTAGRSHSSLSEEDWRGILSDLLHMKEVIFTCIDENTCYEIFALTLLCSGSAHDIKLATHLLTTPHSPSVGATRPPSKSRHTSFSYKIPQESSAQLVIKAAQEYTNSATSYSNQEVHLARLCLQLLGDSSKEAVAEMNLIKSLELLGEMGVEMIPIKIRMCEDRMDILRELLHSKPKAYKQHKKVLELSRLLGLDNEDYEAESSISTGMGKTLSLLAEAGLEQNDGKAALGFCQQMIKARFGGGWAIIKAVAVDIKTQNPMDSLSLLEFVSVHCPPEELEEVLQARNLVEVQVLCAEVSGEGRGGRVKELLGRSAETVEQIWTQGSGRVQQMMSYRPSLTGAVSLVKSATSYLPHLPYLKQSEGTTEQPEDSTAHAQLHMGETSHGGSEAATECEKDLNPVVHPFYETRGRTKSYLTGHYMDIDKGLSLNQCVYRADTLSREEEDASTKNSTQVLLELAEEAFSQDVTLSMSYLLALPSPLNVEQLFDSIRASDFSLQFILYYLSLVLNTHLTHSNFEQLPASLFEDSSMVVENFIKHVASCDLSDQSNEVQKTLDLFKKYHKKLVDYQQAQKLLGLGLGIDVGLFARDQDYKKQTILSLAKSVSTERFTTSLSLAEECGLEEWQVIMSHFHWLLCDSRLPVKDIRQRMKQVKVEEKLLTHPQQTIAAMEGDVYAGVDGRDFPLLIVFFTTLKSCCDAGGTPLTVTTNPATHLKLLKSFKASALDVDYKDLMSGEHSLKLLRPALTHSNVHIVAQLSGKIPSGRGEYLTASQVYRCLVEKLFWSEDSGELDCQTVDWLRRYESCSDYTNRMDCEDLKELVKSVSVSEDALELPRPSRISILQRSIETLQKKLSTLEPTDTGRESCKDSIQELELCLKHLEMFEREKEELQRLSTSEKFELSLSSSGAVKSFAVDMLVEGNKLKDVDLLLCSAQSVQKHSMAVKTVVVDALMDILQDYSSSERRENPLQALDRVCTTCTKDEGRHVNLDEIAEVLLDFVQDTAKDWALRLPVLAILEQKFPSSSVDPSLIVYQRTKVLVESHFQEEISSEDVDSEERRSTLFNRLLAESSSLDRLHALAEVLKHWASSVDQAKQWSSLIEVALGHPNGHSYALYLRCGVKQLSLEEDRALFNKMAASGGDMLSLKYALVSDNKELAEESLGKVASQDEETILSSADGTLLELLVHRGMCAGLVATPLYLSLQQHLTCSKSVDSKLLSLLLDCPEEDVDEKLLLSDSKAHGQIIAKQLYDAGRWVETGSMVMTGIPHFHPSLGTLNTAYDFVSKLFKNSKP